MPSRASLAQTLAVAALACVVCGCSTPAVAPSSGPRPVAKMRQGQAVWRKDFRSPEIAGELLCATDSEGGALLQFSKAPFSIAQVQSDSGRWRAEFGMASRAVGGRLPGPEQLGWLRLEQILAGQPARPPWTFSDDPAGQFTLTNSRTGESFRGYLSP